MEIAAKISTAPAVILPHIKSRLSADLEGDKPRTVVLDENGQPSALTIEELSKEFIENKDFSSIIIASKASGSGATDKTKGSGGAPAKGIDLSKASPKDLRAHLDSKRKS